MTTTKSEMITRVTITTRNDTSVRKNTIKMMIITTIMMIIKIKDIMAIEIRKAVGFRSLNKQTQREFRRMTSI